MTSKSGRRSAGAVAEAPPQPLGRRIKAARERAGLSQEQLARKAELGSMHISKIERGAIKDPGVSIVARIARAIGVSIDSLAG